MPARSYSARCAYSEGVYTACSYSKLIQCKGAHTAQRCAYSARVRIQCKLKLKDFPVDTLYSSLSKACLPQLRAVVQIHFKAPSKPAELTSHPSLPQQQHSAETPHTPQRRHQPAPAPPLSMNSSTHTPVAEGSDLTNTPTGLA